MNVYKEAAEIIRERGWNQGEYMGPGGCVCVSGAIMIAMNQPAQEPTLKHFSLWETLGNADSLIVELALQLGVGCLANWNDAQDRTVDEVLEALEAME